MAAKKQAVPSIIPSNNYVYDGIVVKVLDGDTMEVDLDLGLDVWNKKVKLRLAEINCPEHGTPEGDAATAYVNTLYKAGDSVRLQTILDKSEKYGRYLAKVYHPSLQTSLNDDLVIKGYAKKWNGEGVKPV